jgi:arabinofuranosyltransferase
MIELLVRRRLEVLVAGVAATLSSGVFFFSALRFSNDDQFIFYRYIHNLVSGNGFVYNLGERVLGTTSPLFTLIASALKFVLVDVSVPDVVALLNIGLFSASAVYFYFLCRRFLPSPYRFIAVGVYVLSLARVIPEGMETSLFLLTTFAFLHALFAERHYRGAVFLALAVLTRPDALLIAVLAGIYWLFKIGFLKTVRIGMLALLVLLPWLIFSTLYFGSFIPQSVATKLHSDEIYQIPNMHAAKVQLASISRLYWGRLFDPENIPVQVAVNLAPFLLLSLLGAWKLIRSGAWILAAIPVAYLVSFSVSNPIIFPWYLSQMEPFWILLSLTGIALVLGKVTKKIVPIIMALLLLFGPLYSYLYLATRPDSGSKATAFDAASYLKEKMKPGERVGVVGFGIIGYQTNAPLLDLIGLVSPDSVAYYPVEDACVPPHELYVIPPRLIMDTRPEWIVAGDAQMVPCFREGEWFQEAYDLAYSAGGARIYHLQD